MLECKRPAFRHTCPLSLKFFTTDYKRTAAGDIKCASMVMQDIVSSDDHIRIIIGWFPKIPIEQTYRSI